MMLIEIYTDSILGLVKADNKTHQQLIQRKELKRSLSARYYAPTFVFTYLYKLHFITWKKNLQYDCQSEKKEY